MDFYNQQSPQPPQVPQQQPPQSLAQQQYQYQQQFKYQPQAPSQMPPPPPPPNNPAEKTVMNIAIKGIALVIGLFIIGYLGGALKNIQRIDTFETHNNNTQLSDTTISVPDPTTETTLPVSATLTTSAEYEEKESTGKPTTTKPSTTADVVIDTKEEIVELFNNGANNVKKSAKKVTRFYENRRHDEDLSDYPAVWNTVGGTLIDSWLVNHDTPIEYDEKELIIENFPVKGETWSSKLLPEDVAHATCREIEGYYEIEIYLDYCIDPEENRGPLAVMEEVNTEIVQEFVDIVTDCSVEYYDCIIRCSIEKETGNLVHVKYIEPMALTLTTNRVTTMTGLFCMTFESEYDIVY